MAILAFDVGGSSIKYAAITEQGEILQKDSTPTPGTLEEFYASLIAAREELLTSYPLTGAAFSMPGAVDDVRGVIGGASAIPYIHDFPIGDELSQRLGLSCTMENDANCAALGEAWVGAAMGARDVAFLVIGSGVGGALIKDGRVHHGAHLHGGEFGFMAVASDGTFLSQVGSTAGMVRALEAAKGLAEGSLDGKRAFALADEGDADAKRAIDGMVMHLAVACYNIQYAYDPECIVLGGAVSERAGFVESIGRAAEEIRQRVAIARVPVDIRAASHGNDANLLGAVRHFLDS